MMLDKNVWSFRRGLIRVQIITSTLELVHLNEIDIFSSWMLK